MQKGRKIEGEKERGKEERERERERDRDRDREEERSRGTNVWSEDTSSTTADVFHGKKQVTN